MLEANTSRKKEPAVTPFVHFQKLCPICSIPLYLVSHPSPKNLANGGRERTREQKGYTPTECPAEVEMWPTVFER